MENTFPCQCLNCGSDNMTTGCIPDGQYSDKREQFKHARWFHRCLVCGWQIYLPAADHSHNGGEQLVTIMKRMTTIYKERA